MNRVFHHTKNINDGDAWSSPKISINLKSIILTDQYLIHENPKIASQHKN
jgi:hypothetical protein